MSGARIFLFPQSRRAGLIRNVAHRAVQVPGSERGAVNIIEKVLRQQAETMQRREFPTKVINAAIAELRRAIEAEIAAIIEDTPPRWGRRK